MQVCSVFLKGLSVGRTKFSAKLSTEKKSLGDHDGGFEGDIYATLVTIDNEGSKMIALIRKA